jgi:hypothetical protein
MSYTYTSGGGLVLNKDITKHEYITLCNILSNKLSELYKETVTVIPEDITEGGLLILTKDFINTSKYKTFRHTFINNINSSYRFPWINGDENEKWLNNNDLLFPKNIKAHITLKAFFGAPVWTIKELTIFKNTFKEFGIKYIKMPKTNKQLIQTDDKSLSAKK